MQLSAAGTCCLEEPGWGWRAMESPVFSEEACHAGVLQASADQDAHAGFSQS